MKTLCINLESSRKRRKYMQNQLKKNNIECEFFKAVDGRKLTVDDFYKNGYINETLYNNFKSRKIIIKKRSFACAFSHILIWKNFLENDTENDYILVLEDDFELGKEFQRKLNGYMENTPDNWDFLYFDYNKFVGKKINKFWGSPKNNAGMGKNAFLSCYVINKSGCKKLLDLMYPYKQNLCIDSIMRKNFDKFNAYFSSSRLGHQNKTFPSDRL